jgi:hypothetical protein
MTNYKPFCKHCNSLLTQESEQVSEGYQFACLVCDEDFCTFEVKFKEAI